MLDVLELVSLLARPFARNLQAATPRAGWFQLVALTGVLCKNAALEENLEGYGGRRGCGTVLKRGVELVRAAHTYLLFLLDAGITAFT